MKEYLRNKLKQFLCNHKADSFDKMITTKLVEKRWKYYPDGAREPLKNLERTLYMKVWYICNKCGAKFCLTYKD